MSCSPNNNKFINSSNDIRFALDSIIANDGANVIEKLLLKDVKIPYKQVLKSRIFIKKGQINYLLNHLGLGDNATFLFILATYDVKSKFEEDNYLQYNYSTNSAFNLYFDQLLLLTGNSERRIPQLYLTNPNKDYPVMLDVMVAIIDDNYSFFSNDITNSGSTFLGLRYDYIQTFVENESISISNSDEEIIGYINLFSIAAIENIDKIIIITEESGDKIFLEFVDVFNAKQGLSILTYLVTSLGEIPAKTVVKNDGNFPDEIAPIIYLNRYAGESDIAFVGSTTYSPPFDSTMGVSYSTMFSINDFIVDGNISISSLQDIFVDTVIDNIDGESNNTTLIINNDVSINAISTIGTYSITINANDVAGNNTSININTIIT